MKEKRIHWQETNEQGDPAIYLYEYNFNPCESGLIFDKNKNLKVTKKFIGYLDKNNKIIKIQ